MHRFAATCAVLLLGSTGPALAQDAFPDCPLFVSPDDAAICGIGRDSSLPPLYDPTPALMLLGQRPLLDMQDIDLTTPNHAQPYQVRTYSTTATPLTGYDLPLLDGLTLTGTDALSRSIDAESETNTLKGKFGLAYEEYGVKFKVNPDAALIWSDLAGSGARRLGVDNQASALLSQNLTLTLSAGYDSLFDAADPAASISRDRHRVSLAQHFASGYKFGLSAQRQNEYRAAERRDINSFGLQIGVPLSDSLNFTASHEFALGQKRDLTTRNALPIAGQQQSLDMQMHWTPLALDRRAMTLMAAYSISQEAWGGYADPALAQARLNLAMRF
ncbi:hypothetical protein V6B08_13835 [Ferrovibrio sp. MS7]|uniref:hypothetical protein n=1 Tax=Ferrovibrio plantarum TaxID=3119164 RepID=UPI003134C9D5